MRLERRTRTGAVLGVAIIVGLCAAFTILYAFEQARHELVVIVVADATLALAIFAYVRLRRRLIVLDDRGIETRDAFGNRQLAWDDVAHYFYWSSLEQGVRLLGAFHPLVSIPTLIDAERGADYGALEVVTRDGAHLVIDYRYVDHTALLEAALEQLHTRLRPRPSDYAPFALTATELSHDRAGSLPLDQIRRVDLQRNCVVRPANTWLAWVRVRTSNVRNSMLFVEELLARGVQASVPNAVYIPPLKTDVAGSRPAPLPAAKTVQR